jgi:hypothetical protein
MQGKAKIFQINLGGINSPRTYTSKSRERSPKHTVNLVEKAPSETE